MYGRPEDWAVRLEGEPLAEVVPIVSAICFDGIYVDRLGYGSEAAANAAVRELAKIVGPPLMRSEDGRFLCFDLRRYNERLRSRLAPAELARLRSRALGDT